MAAEIARPWFLSGYGQSGPGAAPKLRHRHSTGWINQARGAPEQRVNLESNVIREDMKTGPELIPPPAAGSAEMALPCSPADTADDGPTTMNRSGEKPPELTPFMRQWTAAKRQNPDALLFFRMGDFYELFYDDAVVASRELQLTLTARDRERQVPMCGVPYHAVEGYLTRLLRKGYRIAICDQMEDPKLTKKIVRREVTRVLSPGTALDAAARAGAEQFSGGAILRSRRKDERDGEPCLRAGAARCFDGRIPDGGVSRSSGAAAGDRRDSDGRRRAKCCWRRARSCRRSSNGLPRARALRTGCGRGTSPCRWWSGN